MDPSLRAALSCVARPFGVAPLPPFHEIALADRLNLAATRGSQKNRVDSVFYGLHCQRSSDRAPEEQAGNRLALTSSGVKQNEESTTDPVTRHSSPITDAAVLCIIGQGYAGLPVK